MSAVLAAALALQTPAALQMENLAFVTQCRFADGPRIILAHRFSARTYRMVIVRGPDDNLLVTITPRPGQPTLYESEGRVRDTEAVAALLDWLLRQRFVALPQEAFMNEFTRADSPPCPAGYRIPR